MIYVPDYLRPHINTDYPQSNKLIFEEWLTQQALPQLEREFIPIHVTAYHVNNNYGQDREAIYKLQEFFDGLDRSKKYWCVWQYDDGLLIDTKDLDIVTFGMSYRLPEQKPTYVIPLIGQMHPKLIEENRYIASFMGNKTHPIRDEMFAAFGNRRGFVEVDGGWYRLDYTNESPYVYMATMAASTFSLCPRGYALPSFRAFEAIHQGSIPVYISDEFMEPYGIDFNEYGVKIHQHQVPMLHDILRSFTPYDIEKKRNRMKELYPILCTYEGVLSKIIDTLKIRESVENNTIKSEPVYPTRGLINYDDIFPSNG